MYIPLVKGVDFLDRVWGNLDKITKYANLKIRIGSLLVSPKAQFSTLYGECYILARTRDDAEIQFFMILTGKDWLIRQINKRTEGLDSLEKMANGSNQETYDGVNNGKNTIKDSSELVSVGDTKGTALTTSKHEEGAKSKSGTTDSSSYDEKYNDLFLDVDGLVNIPANLMSQSGTISVGSGVNTSEDTNNTKGTTDSSSTNDATTHSTNIYTRTTSNASDDFKAALGLELVDLTAQLGKSFSPMFSIHA